VHFLVIDIRFGTPIYVFLAFDPREAVDYPGMPVREITLTLPYAPDCSGPLRGVGRCSIGQDPNWISSFREFASDGAVAGAGYILIEPLYVGPTWQAYAQEFRPQGATIGQRRAGSAVKGKRCDRPV
jgi:hypothetical protein